MKTRITALVIATLLFALAGYAVAQRQPNFDAQPCADAASDRKLLASTRTRNPLTLGRVEAPSQQVFSGGLHLLVTAARGYGGDLQVQSAIDSGEVVCLAIVAHDETPAYMPQTTSVWHGKTSQSDAIDSLTGATYTQRALLTAIDRARDYAASKNKDDALAQ